MIHQRAERYAAHDRGSLLLGAFAINAIILLVVIGYYPFFRTVLRAPALAYEHDQARQVAEAGISEALWELNKPGGPTWVADNWQNEPDICGSPNCQIRIVSNWALPGPYTVSVRSNPPASTPLTDSSTLIVTSIGSVPDVVTPSAVETVQAVLQRPPRVDAALYGHDFVEVIDQIVPDTLIRIDGYDSSIGPYVFGNPNMNNVNVKANSGNFNADIYGGTFSAPSEPSIPRVEIPASLMALEPTCGGGIMLGLGGTPQTLTLTQDTCVQTVWIWNGSTLTLAPGVRLYIYVPGGGSGDILNMYGSGGQRLVAQGNNEVYLSGGVFKVNGADNSAMVVANANPRPQDLRIFQTNVTWSTYTSFLSQQQTFYGTVYADSGRVHVANYDTYIGNPTQWWNATYHGAFAGPLVEFQGAGLSNQFTLHYDTSLGNLTANSGTATPRFRIRNWQQLTSSGAAM